MPIKVASIRPTTEKTGRDGGLIRRYPCSDTTPDEGVSPADSMVDDAAARLRKAADGAAMACLPAGLPVFSIPLDRRPGEDAR